MNATSSVTAFGFDRIVPEPFVEYIKALVAIPPRHIAVTEGEASVFCSPALFNLSNLLNPDAFMFSDGFKLSNNSLDLSRIKELVKLGSVSIAEAMEIIELYSTAFTADEAYTAVKRTLTDISHLEPELYTRTDWSPIVRQVLAQVRVENIEYSSEMINAFCFLYTKLNSSQRDWVQVFNGDSDRAAFKEFYRWVAQALSMGHLSVAETMMLSSAKNPLRSKMDNFEGMSAAYSTLGTVQQRYMFTRLIASVFIDHGESIVDFEELATIVSNESNTALPVSLLEKMLVHEYVPTDNHGDVYTLREKLDMFNCAVAPILNSPESAIPVR